ncbi:MAG: hypothetical protein KC468_28765, partial [Myxococcales bacterium]|nr:hypothetical protein [Myxococcales bacterium]
MDAVIGDVLGREHAAVAEQLAVELLPLDDHLEGVALARVRVEVEVVGEQVDEQGHERAALAARRHRGGQRALDPADDLGDARLGLAGALLERPGVALPRRADRARGPEGVLEARERAVLDARAVALPGLDARRVDVGRERVHERLDAAGVETRVAQDDREPVTGLDLAIEPAVRGDHVTCLVGLVGLVGLAWLVGLVGLVDLAWLVTLAVERGPEPVEDGVTFAENALIKARAAAAHTGLAALADDSGICVDVLGGSPGVFSAYWAGQKKDAAANLALLLDQLRDVADPHRAAQFRSTIALVPADGEEQVVEGVWPGRLAHEASGDGGFGYDPIFIPDGQDA